MLTGLFSAWSMFHAWREGFQGGPGASTVQSARQTRASRAHPPLPANVAGILFVLYGGGAHSI
ncbi:MAG: hypothetical protein CM1200mP36_04530 [Gammaproteobacteria bacterium]|nr:MAG: hypothetical protein CM1200mP36_04530 [Gammaproteobacteria bacterium]